MVTNSAQDVPEPKPQPGRPRDLRSKAAILAATIELVRDVGYAGLTIEGVARRAGVSKATIYRWWENKGLLVYEAVFTRVESGPLPDTGNVEDDLRILVEGLVEEFSTPEAAAAMLGLLADFSSDDRLRELIRERFLLPSRTLVGAVLQRAVERGQICADVPIDVMLDALAGAVFFRVVLVGEDLVDEVVEDLVKLTLRGVRVI